jgi:hypothetical protein
VTALRKLIFWLIGALAIVACLSAIPVAIVETQCTASPQPATPNERFDIKIPGYRRAEGDSYLTFPEWYIVYAYDDLAGVTRQSSESGFDYLQSIRGFWTSLCGSTATAGAVGPVTFDQRVTNYIIGVTPASGSFRGCLRLVVIGMLEHGRLAFHGGNHLRQVRHLNVKADPAPSGPGLHRNGEYLA